MTAPEPLDRDLAAAFAFEPAPATLHAMDRRMAAAIAAAQGRWRPPQPASRPVPRAPWFRRRPVALGAVAVLAITLVAATTSLIGLYDELGGEAYRIAWDRGQAPGLSQTRDGYRVTLERAYADGATLMLALSVEDVDGRGHSQVGAAEVRVAASGAPYRSQFGVSSPFDERTAANAWWFAAADLVAPGPRTFTVTVPAIAVRDAATPPPPAAEPTWNPWHEVAGPWTFTIRLDVAGGTAVTPGATASAGGVALVLESVLISPTAVRARLMIPAESRSSSAAGPGEDAGWAVVGRVFHDGRLLDDGGGMVAAGTLELTAGTGVDDASGDWRIVVDELVGMGDRVAGPWEFRFGVP